MSTNTSNLEGLKTRHDLFKHIGTTSVLIIAGFLALQRSLIDTQLQFARDHFNLAFAVVANFAVILVLSILASEGVARSMRGEEPCANKFVKVMVWLLILLLLLGCALFAYYCVDLFYPAQKA